MRSTLLTLAIAALSFGSLGEETQSPVEQAHAVIATMGGFVAASKVKNIYLLSEDERQILIRYFRSKLEKLATPGTDPTTISIQSPEYRDRLLRLGDLETVTETVATVMQAEVESSAFEYAFSHLLDAGRPETVAMLAPRVFVDEPYVNAPADDSGSGYRKAYRFAAGILRIIEISPAFSDSVRHWARDNQLANGQSMLPMVRTWWKENEQFFKNGDYRTVRPGADIRTSEIAATKDEQARIKAFVDNLRAQGKDPNDPANSVNVKLPPVARPTAEPNVLPSARVQTAGLPGRTWLWVVILIASVVIAGLVWKRRSH